MEFIDCHLSEGQILHDKYIISTMIGEGAYSTVWKANNKYAIKVYKSGTDYCTGAKKEYKLLCDLQHKNVLHPIDKFVHYTQDNTSAKHYCLVYDLCDFDLGMLIDSRKILNSSIPMMQYVKLVMRDLLSGLNYLHSQKIIHSDIKPENILFQKGIAKIADLNTADYEYVFEKGIVGTRYYRAPEVLLGLNLTTAIDIWSTGCVLFELLTGDILFRPKSIPAKKISQKEHHIALIIELCGSLPAYMANGCYAPNICKSHKNNDITTTNHIETIERWSITDVLKDKYKLNDPFFIVLLNHMLRLDPVERATAKELLDLF